MTREEILDLVRKVVNEQLRTDELDPEEITLEATFTEDLGLDSLEFLDMTVTLEEILEIEISNEDLGRMSTVGQTVQTLEALVQQGGS